MRKYFGTIENYELIDGTLLKVTLYPTIADHSFSTYAEFSEKLIFHIQRV